MNGSTHQDGSAPLAVPHQLNEPVPPALNIAIVGMGCLLPGAHEIRAFWENILRKRDLVGEVPPDRFQSDRWFDQNRAARDKMYSRWGGFLEDVPFNPLKYGIPPKAIPSIEPAQLLTLELVDQTLRDAGYSEQNPFAPRTSVILGAGGGMGELGTAYAVRAMLPQYVEDPNETLWDQLPEWTEDSFPGFLLNVISGRVSNRFNLGGVNFTVDAACASSLAAVYLACRELADGASDLAIAGGVDTMQHPFSYMAFSKTGALSPTGKSRPFDSAADGIAISEGLAAVVLKRVDDAQRDGDRIYAVIRGIAGGSDGRHKSLTAPSSKGQARTLLRSYAQAGYSPATCDLFEAHGTGTSVGDQTECETLTELLATEGAAANSKAIGSVKSMIGHTKSAAGVVGLIKGALSLYCRVLPPTLHVQNPNEKGGFGNGALYPNSELRPWIRGKGPRRTGVSAFGFGGTNFHATLEEYGQSSSSGNPRSPSGWRPAELFAFQGESTDSLLASARFLLGLVRKTIENNASVELADLAHAWYREQKPSQGIHRAAIVSSSLEELGRQLELLQTGLNGEAGTNLHKSGIHIAGTSLGTNPRIAFLFPGQGSQFPNMLRELAVEFEEVSDCFADADRVLGDSLDRPLSHFIFPTPAFNEEASAKAFEQLKATEVAQPALGVCGLATLRLLRTFGVAPQLVAGHSYGELVALHAAGVYDADTLYRLSWQRAEAMLAITKQQDTDLGQMMAVSEAAGVVEAELAQCDDVWLANLNAPKQTIISGTREGLAKAAARLKAAGLSALPIPVACAFHSPLMRGARDRFAEALKRVPFGPATVPVYSNVTANAYPADATASRHLLVDQIVNRVRFVEQIESMHGAGARLFIEAGPGGVLSKLVSRILEGRPHRVIATQPKDGHGLTNLLHALAGLFVAGSPINWERLYKGRPLAEKPIAELAESKREPHGAQTWLINGGYSRPASAPKRIPKPAARMASAALPTSPSVQSETVDMSHSPSQPQNVSAPVVPQSVDAVSADSAAAFQKFQETMQRFLETQQAVMAAFFGGSLPDATSMRQDDVIPLPESSLPFESSPGSGSNDWEPPRIHSRTAAADDVLPLSTPSYPAVDNPAPLRQDSTARQGSMVRTAVSAESLLDQLLAIVSDRTGYPTEMLDIDADMEAELGIDSIKRVEILSAFRKTALSQSQDSSSLTEKMTTAKNMRAILASVNELLDVVDSEAPRALETATATVPMADTLQKDPVREEAIQMEAAQKDAAPPLASLEATDVLAALVGIVSQRTGYPADMLDVNADIEADLGIDSIKRVEINSEFRRALLPVVEEPPTWFMEAITHAKTLNEIVASTAKLESSFTPAAPVSVEPQETVEPLPTEPLAESAPRCVGTVVEVPVHPVTGTSLPDGLLLLTDDGDGVASMLQANLEAAGHKSVILDVLALSSPEAAQQAVEKIRSAGDRIGGVIHLLPLRPAPSFPGITRDVWNYYADPELKGMLFLIQALAPELQAAESESVFVSAVSVGGGDFPELLQPTHPWRGGLSGLLKTAACEWPHARFSCINLKDVAVESLLDALQQEYSTGGPVDVAYVDGHRYAVQSVREELTSTAPAHPVVKLTERDVVLVLGGGRGITAEVVQELSAHTSARFVLLGRSPLPAEPEDAGKANIENPVEMRRLLVEQLRQNGKSPTPKEVEAHLNEVFSSRELRRTLATLKQQGTTAEYVRCDARNDAELTRVVQDVQDRLGPVTAVIHGAGRIEDRLIRDKTSESFDRVVGTKIDPLLTLSRILETNRLKLVMLFSSVSGFFGNTGQADYAAGNETINRMASRLNQIWPAKVVAMNWGPWAGSGMVTPEVARQFASRRIELVSVPAGRHAAWQELWSPSSDVRVVIGGGPWVEEADHLAEQLAESGDDGVIVDQVRSGLDRVDTLVAAGR